VTRVRFPRLGGVPLGRRLIAVDRGRFAITIAGIGFAVMLMLFLLALYHGVRTEANGYVASRPVHVWVAQDNTTNFIKSSSFLLASRADELRAVAGVEEVSPLLRLITTVTFGDREATAIVLGIDPLSRVGLPQVAEGIAAPARGEIVLDGAIARRHRVHRGDTILVQARPFRVVGVSRGTNSVLTQLAFITLDDARQLLGISEVASFFLVRGADDVSADELARRLRGKVQHTNVLTRDAFAENNMQEMRSGLLPILATVAVLGGVVALAVLTLLLYGAILERREVYALLKAIGAGDAYLTRLVLTQSLAAVVGGFAFGALAYLACAPLTVLVVPEMALALTVPAVAGVGAATTAMGVAGALLPLRRVRRIFPAELFRA